MDLLYVILWCLKKELFILILLIILFAIF